MYYTNCHLISRTIATILGSDHSFFRLTKKCTTYLIFRIGWIDISNLLAKVPIINGNIYVKILTIPSDKENKLFNK